MSESNEFSSRFLVGPVSDNISSSSYEFIDLDDIFADDFFPEGLDFSDFAESQSSCSVGKQQNSSTDSHHSGISIDCNPFEQEPDDSKDAIIPDTRIAMRGSSLSSRLHGSSSSTTVILIPPMMPRQQAAPERAEKQSKPSTETTSSMPDYDDENDRDNYGPADKKRRKIKAFDPKDMTEQQRVERRERNREHAKRSRIRKKVLLDALQGQLSLLRGENGRLRRVVVERLPEASQKIFEQCTTEESMLLSEQASSSSDLILQHSPRDIHSDVSANSIPAVQSAKILMEPDYRLVQSLMVSQQNFVLSDPSLPDNPIVYASSGFCKLTGYKRQEVLGRNCRFLQGPGTDQAAVDIIRKGVAEGRDISVCLLNYKANGTAFWNQFFVAALRDADGSIVNFVGVQCPVNAMPISEIKERVKRLPMPDDL